MTFTLRYLKGTDKKAFTSGAPDLEANTCKTFGTFICERLKWTIGSFSLASCVLQELVKLSSIDVKISSESKSTLFVLF